MKTFLLATVAAVLAAVPCFAQEKNPVVVMETSLGTMKIELYPQKAPMTVKNFLDYVEAKHYDGTIFHRVIANFMIQGGGFDDKLNEKKTKAPIKNEAGLANERGTIAMARTSAPHSATAQFFINSKDNPFLDKANAQDGWGYCVFGKVIDGLDVLDKIRQVKTGKGVLNIQGQPAPSSDVPVEMVTIKSVRVLKAQ